MPFLPSAYLDTVTMILKSRERDRPYSATGFFFRHCVGGEREAERLYLVTSASALGTELETVGLICRRSRGIGCKAYPELPGSTASDAEGGCEIQKGPGGLAGGSGAPCSRCDSLQGILSGKRARPPGHGEPRHRGRR